MLYYFAYGSNLHHIQMKRRCPNCRFIKKITLKNYRLTDGHFDCIYSSTLERAYETAEIISRQLGLKIWLEDRRLAENTEGVYAGLNKDSDAPFLGPLGLKWQRVASQQKQRRPTK